MSIADFTQLDAANPSSEAAPIAVSYLVDCGWMAADIKVSHFSLALEYSYKALPRFWRKVDHQSGKEAILERFPDRRSTEQRHDLST
jgi:hypothetical protein